MVRLTNRRRSADDSHVVPRRAEEPIENTWPLFSECVATKAGVYLTGRRCTFGVEPALPSMPGAGDNLERRQNHM